ncbi:MAG: hypothetical protein JXO22_01300, partial [Phycisphaerae bacterium]|nr:hypothetical protein [Phycisphaerae bacterium]
MPDESTEVRKIDWAATFPFVRLFRTFRLATAYTRLALAFVAVVLICFGGWVLDAIWVGQDAGAVVTTTVSVRAAMTPGINGPGLGVRTFSEIDAYLSRPKAEFDVWVKRTAAARDSLARQREELEKNLKESDAGTALAAVDAWLKAELERIDGDKNLADDQKDAGRDGARLAADTVRFVIRLTDPTPLGLDIDTAQSRVRIEDENQHAAFVRAVDYGKIRIAQMQQTLRGPLATLRAHEMKCFAAAIQGVCAGHLGFSEGPGEPGMARGIVMAAGGVLWLVVTHPFYMLLFGLWSLVILGFIGGTICRHAAIQSARDESISWGAAISFAASKWREFVLAPIVPVIAILALGVLMLFGGVIGGLVGLIPVIGPILSGLAYGLAIIGGLLMALVLIGSVLGLHLMWPAIAVESSDFFDAITRAFGYIMHRLWNTVWYTLVLLVYGAFSFVMVRLIALVTLKMTHSFTGAGLSWFGAHTSAQTDTVAKLDAMWSMPAWNELSLLPSADGVPFWGVFAMAPLNWGESIWAFFISIWVLMVAGLVVAFVISFFLCGSTEMYFLLRRDLDATDWDEVYYEEEDDLL